MAYFKAEHGRQGSFLSLLSSSSLCPLVRHLCRSLSSLMAPTPFHGSGQVAQRRHEGHRPHRCCRYIREKNSVHGVGSATAIQAADYLPSRRVPPGPYKGFTSVVPSVCPGEDRRCRRLVQRFCERTRSVARLGEDGSATASCHPPPSGPCKRSPRGECEPAVSGTGRTPGSLYDGAAVP